MKMKTKLTLVALLLIIALSALAFVANNAHVDICSPKVSFIQTSAEPLLFNVLENGEIVARGITYQELARCR